MTKRDLADIVLAAIGITFIPTLLQAISGFAFYLGINDYGAEYTNKVNAIFFSTFHVVVFSGMCYVLLFKRHVVLDALHLEEGGRSAPIPESLVFVASYAFWIRLIGVYMFLRAGTDFLGMLTVTLASKDTHSIAFLNGRSTWQLFVVAVLSLVIIAKADHLGRFIQRKASQPVGESEASTTTSPEPEDR